MWKALATTMAASGVAGALTGSAAAADSVVGATNCLLVKRSSGSAER